MTFSFNLFAGFLLSATCLLSTACKQTPKKKSNEIPRCQNINARPIALKLLLTPVQDTFFVLASNSGKLESISAQNGKFVRKGTVIATLENRRAFVQISEKKKNLKARLNSLNFPPTLKSVEKKWFEFGEAIETESLLPVVPKFTYKEEVAFLEEQDVVDLINSVIILEKQYKRFFVRAKQSGIFISKIDKGMTVAKGEVLGYILPDQHLKTQLEENIVYGSKGLRLTSDPRTYIVFSGYGEHFDLASGKDAQGVKTVKSDFNAFRLPASAVKNDSIRIILKERVVVKKVHAVLRTSNWVYVKATSDQICLVP